MRLDDKTYNIEATSNDLCKITIRAYNKNPNLFEISCLCMGNSIGTSTDIEKIVTENTILNVDDLYRAINKIEKRAIELTNEKDKIERLL